MKTICFFILFTIGFCFLKGQDSLHVRKRVALALSAEVVGYGTILYGLNKAWYANYPKSKFHFFNDNREWLQMDKVGHMGSCYYFGRIGYETIKWTGISDRKAIIWGGSTGFMYLTIIEALDGFSQEWGASPGDLVANFTGTALFIGQQLHWKEQKIKIKFSFSGSEYSAYRPNLLGNSFGSSLMKDYNGQTYWMSFRPENILNKTPKLPWLNLAFGYSAEGMIGGEANPVEHNGVLMPYFPRYRQHLLSVDIDWDKVPVKSKILRKAFIVFDMIKIPAPAIEFNNQNGWKAHWLYF